METTSKKHIEKRILFLIDTFTFGGAQTVLCNVVRNLDPQSYSAFVISLFEDGEVSDTLRKFGVYSHCLYMRSPFSIQGFLHYLPQLLDFVRQYKIDLVHSFLTASGIYGGIVAKILQVPSILNVHAPLSKGKNKYLELMARNLNDILILCNMLTLKELKRTRLFGRRGSIKLIYNGIYPMGEPVSNSLNSETVTLTTVANFFPEKDHLTLIKAFEILKQKHHRHLKLQIIGEGEVQYKEKVFQYVYERNIRDIEFLGAVRDIYSYLCRTDIFVLTSHSEGLPISVTEAMSVGLPVVASDVGALNEIIDHRKDGVLVPPRSVDALIDAIDELIQDKELRMNLSKNAISKFREKFTIERMIKEYHSLYRSCFDKNRPQSSAEDESQKG